VPDKGVNVYLYQVTPNAAARNDDLPARGSDGRLVQRPRAALDLQYLLTFYGSDSELEPQRLLGGVVRALHARPVLTRPMLQHLVDNPPVPFVGESDLARDLDVVRFTPSALSLEEMSKLWSVFFQTRHALSVAYQAGAVLIETTDTPPSAMPVRARNVRAIPFHQPVLERTLAQKGPAAPVAQQPIVAGDILVLAGRQLSGELTRVRIDRTLLEPDAVGDTRISIPLASPPFPADSLRAGVHGVQVVHDLRLGTPGDPHRGAESNVLPFVLRPSLSNVSATAAVVSLDVAPAVGRAQRVRLLLNECTQGAPGAAYTFPAPPRTADLATLAIPIAGVTAGQYFVRLQIDGAESLLDLDAGSPAFGPVVAIP
jgi:hypothetical protein